MLVHGGLKTLFAVRGHVDLEAFFHKAVGNEVGDGLLVVYDEDGFCFFVHVVPFVEAA